MDKLTYDDLIELKNILYAFRKDYAAAISLQGKQEYYQKLNQKIVMLITEEAKKD